ncbi:cysteine hydrolase [Pseudarthrobacter sp. fls2-241-R2A-168]|uniref:cysteine hydrolase n=1 Tax=Pseudarthrobacter sp. fls2-241-R2A-168 TaxID=3040304 RepID=UPI002552EB21|nr:cysteine hydrolase [Pseudarthrobacter sp. fls2-241-R2A-168]
MVTLNPATTALLAVHLQHDIVSPGTAFGQMFHPEVQSRDVLTQCRKAMQSLRDAGGLVVPLRIAFMDNYSDLNRALPLLQMVAQAGCLKEASEGSAIVAEVDVHDSDEVVIHQLPGPFSGSKLQEILASRGVENVVICGVATNASVEAAVRQAADLGYGTYVLSDATSAADNDSHQASLASMGLFAQVITLEEFTAALPSHVA